MASSSAQNGLEEELKDAGNKLLMLPSSTNELLNLLDKAEHLLSCVVQAPPKTTQDALLPLIRALNSKELLRHFDVDVKVSVTSCIAELIRITAPDAPYNDEEMKEIFHLTVMAFGKLSNGSGHCYSKAIQILDNVAKVRSCVLMLDLECDELIATMFQQFLNTIRCSHSHDVFLDMEAIMTLVIKESEEISLELLSLLLASVKKESQNVSPLSWKLGEQVLKNCATELRPYLPKAVKSMNLAFVDYAEVVSAICQDAPGREHLMAEELASDIASLGQVGPSVDELSKSMMNDGTAEKRNDCNLEDKHSLKTLERCHQMSQEKSTGAKTDSQSEKLDVVKVAQQETDQEEAPKKRGRRPNSLIKPEEGYVHSWIHSGRKTLEMSSRRKSHETKGRSSPKDSASKESTLSFEPEKKIKASAFSAKTPHSESASASSHNHGFPDGSYPTRGQPKKKVITTSQDGGPDLTSIQEEDLLRPQIKEKTSHSADVASKKESEGMRNLKTKSRRCLRKNELAAKTTEESTLSNVVVKKDGFLSMPEGKERSLIRKRDGNDRSRGKITSEKCVTGASGDKDFEVPHAIKDYGEELVGCKIKVWWPLDQMFYEGSIASFDPIKKKHKVLYADGDEEILTLSMERFELLGNMLLDELEQENNLQSPAASSKKLPKKKTKTKSKSSIKENMASLSKSGGSSAKKSKKNEAPEPGSKSADGSAFDFLCTADKSKNKPTETCCLLNDGGQKSQPETEIPRAKHDALLVEIESHTSNKVRKKHSLSQDEVGGNVAAKEELLNSLKAQGGEAKSAKKRQKRVKS